MLASSARLALAVTFEREMEEGRGFLWLPVLFGVGILIYFGAPSEPSLIALSLLTVGLAAVAATLRRRIAAFRILFALTAVAAGTAAMKARTDWVEAPVLSRETTATVRGWIQSREESGPTGARVVLRVHDIAGVAAANLPVAARFTVRSRAGELAVGDPISATAGLQAPGGPVMPGAFDFGRAAFYDRIGAVGFAYGAAKPAPDLGGAPLDIRLAEPLAALRETMRVRIEAALPGDNGHIAAALIMGDQRGISDSVQDDMRASGLGHILSISGLHLALVAGSIFWLVRALLALSPTLALRWPIKKWAATAALAVSTFYLGISGAEVATVRSYVMLAIMLVAITLDRRALTLRNVALAAMVILIFSPDSLLSISFQMSFAATLALVAAYEAISRRGDRGAGLAERHEPTLFSRAWQAGSTLLLTSLVAGLATAPFSAFHFQRLAPLTLVANMAVSPAIGFVVMPMALVAVVLMPFGAEAWPFAAMSWGLDWMTTVARQTAEWSAGLGGIAMPPVAALLLSVAGLLWLRLWREPWRLAGLVTIAASLLVAALAPRPDMLIDASGAAAAVRGSDGRFSILGKAPSFDVETWLRSDADPRDPQAANLHDGVRCDPLGCATTMAADTEVSLVLEGDAFAEDCGRAAVIVTPLAAPAWCGQTSLVIDRQKLAAGGSVAIYRENTNPAGKPQFRVETAYPAIRRPFMPPAPEARRNGQ